MASRGRGVHRKFFVIQDGAVALDKIDSDIFASATGWNSVSG
jgi:hypothetical protein